MVNKKEKAEVWIREAVMSFVKSPQNTFKNRGEEPAWAEPLVGFSSGGDPLYKFFKKDIGDFYLSPMDFFAIRFPEIRVTEDQLTVVSWILPQTDITKADNRREKYFPSERWAMSRVFGEEVNDELRRHMVKVLEQAGIEAVAPVLSPLFKRQVSERYGFASTWSERHAAYVGGLGTFGLSDGLITPKGKAMRCGSVVARVIVPSTVRPYTDHHAYCLFYSEKTCGRCIARCPIGAITTKGHDKNLCSRYLNMTREYSRRHCGLESYGCGLCQSDVPCESGIPERGVHEKYEAYRA